jgi:hypothetical protein
MWVNPSRSASISETIMTSKSSSSRSCRETASPNCYSALCNFISLTSLAKYFVPTATLRYRIPRTLSESVLPRASVWSIHSSRHIWWMQQGISRLRVQTLSGREYSYKKISRIHSCTTPYTDIDNVCLSIPANAHWTPKIYWPLGKHFGVAHSLQYYCLKTSDYARVVFTSVVPQSWYLQPIKLSFRESRLSSG